MIIVSNSYVEMIKYELGSDPPPPPFWRNQRRVGAMRPLMFKLELPLYLESVEEKESARLQDQEVQGHHHLHQLEQYPQVELF